MTRDRGPADDPSDVFRGEELGGRKRVRLDADEAVHRLLVALHRADQLPLPGESVIEGGDDQLGIAEGVVDAHRGDRVLVVAGVAEQGPARSEWLLGTVFPGSPRLLLRTIAVRRKGPLTFTLDPTDAAREQLSRVGSLKAKITLAYIPRGQPPQKRTAEVTLIAG